MNILTKSTGARSWLVAAAIAVTVVAYHNTAVAADPADLPAVKVSFADLNLASIAGAKTLYARIRAAASRVCTPLEGRSVGDLVQYQACFQSAIARAVTSVGSPTLTAVYEAHGGHSKPLQVAAAKR